MLIFSAAVMESGEQLDNLSISFGVHRDNQTLMPDSRPVGGSVVTFRIERVLVSCNLEYNAVVKRRSVDREKVRTDPGVSFLRVEIDPFFTESRLHEFSVLTRHLGETLFVEDTVLVRGQLQLLS